MAIFKKLHKRTGVEFYYIRFHVGGGKWRKEKAGTTSAQADKLLKRRMGEVASGTYVDPKEKASTDEGVTFAEFVKRFKAEYVAQRRSNHYDGRLKHLEAHFVSRTMREIRPADFDLYRGIRSRQVGASTLRKELTVLGTVFKMAVRWGVLEASPAVGLEKPREPAHKTRYLSGEEWRALEVHAPRWLRPMMTLAVLTGMRLKELVGLRWEDWDRKSGILYLSEDNKTATPRAIPIGEEARAMLEELDKVRRIRTAYIFVNRKGAPYTGRNSRQFIARRVKAAMRDAGIQGASFHTLRHTAGSWLAQAGESEVKIAKLLGHASPRTTERYMHLSPEHLRGTASKLDEAIRATVPQAAPQNPPQNPPSEASSEASHHARLGAVRP
jgi:integrase